MSIPTFTYEVIIEKKYIQDFIEYLNNTIYYYEKTKDGCIVTTTSDKDTISGILSTINEFYEIRTSFSIKEDSDLYGTWRKKTPLCL